MFFRYCMVIRFTSSFDKWRSHHGPLRRSFWCHSKNPGWIGELRRSFGRLTLLGCPNCSWFFKQWHQIWHISLGFNEFILLVYDLFLNSISLNEQILSFWEGTTFGKIVTIDLILLFASPSLIVPLLVPFCLMCFHVVPYYVCWVWAGLLHMKRKA